MFFILSPRNWFASYILSVQEPHVASGYHTAPHSPGGTRSLVAMMSESMFRLPAVLPVPILPSLDSMRSCPWPCGCQAHGHISQMPLELQCHMTGSGHRASAKVKPSLACALKRQGLCLLLSLFLPRADMKMRWGSAVTSAGGHA